MCCTHIQSFSRPFFLFDDRCFNVVEDERPVEDDEEERMTKSSVVMLLTHRHIQLAAVLSLSRFCIAKDYIRVIGHLIHITIVHIQDLSEFGPKNLKGSTVLPMAPYYKNQKGLVL